ncbi:unnamed protein product [Toxocara canis]|uniref:separase n=1 Tax=Toxocara canis TaxID=6265 RepID=A0A183UZ22_TOXCA|nr:unnamed protein product [Toxocara canis]
MVKGEGDGEEGKFRKAKQYLGYLLQKHLLLAGEIQTEFQDSSSVRISRKEAVYDHIIEVKYQIERVDTVDASPFLDLYPLMFNAVKKEEDNGFHFFDTTHFETHAALSKLFIAALAKHKAHFYLERAYSFWSEQFAPAVLALESKEERTTFAQFPKLLAAYLLVAGEYSKVVVCLAHAIRLNEFDPTCRILILRWLCHLGEWQLAKKQLDIEAKLPPISGTHYDLIIDIYRNIVALNTLSKKNEVVEKLVMQWNRLSEEGSKTFMQYQCQALLKRALFIASRLPHADINIIGDPLKNSEMEIARLTVLIKNRYQAFFNYGEGIELQKKVVNPDDFLKLCSHISEHFEATILQCYELAETGVLRECEGIVMSLWRESFRLGSLPRALIAINLLMMLVMMSNYMRKREQSLRQVYAALLNVPKRSDDSSNTAERSPDPGTLAKEPSLAALMLHAFCYGQESGDGEKKEEKIEDDKLESHNEKCTCVVCATCEHDLQLQFDISFAAFLFDSFSSHSFQTLATKFRTLETKFARAHSCMCNAIGACVDAESCYPLSTRNTFLTAAVRWLHKNGTNEKPEIKNKVIRESLKPCHHRWQWLTIRQLEREPMIDRTSHLPWMLPSVSSDRIRLSSLAEDFDALSLQTPRKAQLRKAPQSAVKTSTRMKRVEKVRVLSDSETANGMNPRYCQLYETANEDFEQYSHLFYRDNWMSAYFFSEATCFATRQLARTVDEEGESFRFENLEQFKTAVQALPSDITVVQLFLDASRVLWLIRLHCERVPLIVPVVTLPAENDLLKRMEVLLRENDLSGNMGATCKDAKKFWALRRRLDKSMEEITKDVEAEWLRDFACLLLPCFRLSEYGLLAASEISQRGFSDGAAKVLVEMCSVLSAAQWRRLVERFAVLEDVRQTSASFNAICRLRNEWENAVSKGDSLIDENAIAYTLLAVSPIPKFVDGRNSFYLLDPGGDLAETQNRLAERLRTIECWKGLIGESPDPKQLKTFLESSDFFFYMGHGSGGRYFGKASIRKTDCRAVSVLMGCSSARTTYEGEGLDGRSAVFDYSVARCPCVVGCLWMVTDGEIDRFFLAMISYCFSDEIIETQTKRDKNGGSYRLLIDALAYARTACKLRYMTGGAVVAYGLPIVSAYSRLLKTNRSH